MIYQAQSIAKWGETENEDSWFFHHNTSCFTLADGAGGVGLFSKEWAQTLAESIEHLPSNNGVLKKIHELKIDFYNRQEAFLEKNPEYFSDKFFEEGSAATLLVSQLAEGQKIKTLAYGDSGFFLYHSRENSLETNIKPDHLIDLPILLNSKEPSTREDALFYDELSYEPGDTLILVSDALAQYLFLIHLFECRKHDILDLLLSQQTSVSDKVRKLQRRELFSFFETIQQFKFALTSENSFSEHCKNLFDEGLIDYDDYTMILVEL
jgi:serine/threonine protein phosphatase PrpC